jgi:hypothetical protein
MEVLAELPAGEPQETGTSSGSGSKSTRSQAAYHDARHKERVFMPEIFATSCKWIPMRLTAQERQLLEVLENALVVSDYTDTVDIWARSHKQSRVFEGLRDVLSIATGLMVANSLKAGEALMVGKNLDQNIPFFRDMFEVGRRYKIMNPTKMRETYGKMMFILQDTVLVGDELGDSFIKKISTVHSYLQNKDKLHLLLDSRVLEATQSIDNSDGSLSRDDLLAMGAGKAEAARLLKEKYRSDDFSEEDIQLVLDSVSDNEAYLALNARPVERMIHMLTDNFNPKAPTGDFSLELRGGGGGGVKSTLSNLYGYSRNYFGGGHKLLHSHEKQFHFVHQSFLLWHELMKNMPKLWLLADRDLVHERYRLTDTGQGLHRMQSCPAVSEEMARLLHRVQGSVGQAWVGLSVVHLGDRDVPNGWYLLCFL